jgi:hypothetical protein
MHKYVYVYNDYPKIKATQIFIYGTWVYSLQLILTMGYCKEIKEIFTDACIYMAEFHSHHIRQKPHEK